MPAIERPTNPPEGDPEAPPIDAATFAAFRAGDERAMGVVVRRLHQRLIGFVRLYTRSVELAEEIAQETFLDAYLQRASIHGPDKLRPWLFTVAKRKAIKEMSRRHYGSEIPLDAEDLAALSSAVEGGQTSGLLTAQLRAHLARALNALNEQERDLLTLRFFGGLQIKEIADALSMPMGSVGVKLQRTLDKVRLHLEKDGLRLEDLLP